MKQSVCVHVRKLKVLPTNGSSPIGPIVVTQRGTTSGPTLTRDNSLTINQRKLLFESQHQSDTRLLRKDRNVLGRIAK